MSDQPAVAQQLRDALLAAREVLDWIDGHGCDEDSRQAEKGWKAIDAALQQIDSDDDEVPFEDPVASIMERDGVDEREAIRRLADGSKDGA